MLEINKEGFIQVYYPVDAVTYPKFAELIGKSPEAVKTMVRRNKLPVVPWRNPETSPDANTKDEKWVYIPEFNRAMRDAFMNRPKEQRDAWLLWIGL